MDMLPALSPEFTVTGRSNRTIGQVANDVADRTAHDRYTKRKGSQTIRRQKADLLCFVNYLESIPYNYEIRSFVDALKADEPVQHLWYLWQGITYGIVEAFIPWQEQQGYAIGSINVHIATVKAYCKLAYKAGAISHNELANTLMITGYSHKEGKNIDKQRHVTRVGDKKPTPTMISPGHAALLKKQKRPKDAVMICLLLDLGLRVGELTALQVDAINLAEGKITFYREKVDITQTHLLTADCLEALSAYLPSVKGTYLFPGYQDKKAGKERPMKTSSVNKQVGILGERIGIQDLSPHDCRHHLITEEAKKGTDATTLQQIGGWSSPAMALKYVIAAEIANSGASFFRQRRKGE